MKALYCINFSRWKQKYIHAFLSSFGEIVFVSSVKDAKHKGFGNKNQLVSWASKNQSETLQMAKKVGGALWLVEDGFIRSTGLGSDLTAPASIVLDKSGIYYDPTKPSDLETLLESSDFAMDQFARADLLKDNLLKNALSKYNVGGEFKRESLNIGEKQKIILVPGQVEDDASIKKGCVDVNTNSALIESVKKNNPEAFVIYKAHPDVVSGNRKGRVSKNVTDVNCDLVLQDVSITDCLDVVDEVHTMTSLVGFEALMRELKVVCYGIPFYSGWGLTEDHYQTDRRTRKLSLNELIHATLIDYPLYMDWMTEKLTTPEIVVAQLTEQIEQQGGKQKNKVFWFNRFARKIHNFIRGVS